MANDEWVVTMPKLGETVTEGTIGSWLKQAGETVKDAAGKAGDSVRDAFDR